eukprot:c12408_g2_i1.p1 GENE.c12408_g2_i1~~c12408_g2_i1.p1  ORF type:complete len:161 (-),score=27.85 c12408_g2_i1:81-563(-)
MCSETQTHKNNKHCRPGYICDAILSFDEMSEAIMQALYHFTRVDTANCLGDMSIIPLGGRISEVPPQDTAFSYRKARYWVIVEGRFRPDKQGEEAKVTDWVKRFRAAMLHTGIARETAHPTCVAGDLTERDCQSLGSLQQVKAKYDPDNLLAFNRNIKSV